MTTQPSEQPRTLRMVARIHPDIAAILKEPEVLTEFKRYAKHLWGSGVAIEAEAAAPDPVASPPEARDKLATILHQRESAGKARCGPNSRGCRMRHRMDAASILMEVGLDPVASPAPLEARGLLDRCRAVIEAEWAEGIVDNARRREGWALINEIGRYLAATEETP